MSKNKSKIVKWEYVTEPFDVKVLPSLFTRLHSPLTPWLSSLTENCCVHLRPCLQGVDEDGAVVKYLYCTRDGRFFVRDKDGWNEIKTNCVTPKGAKRGGCSGIAAVRNFGNKLAHRCVAFAWLDVPRDVKLQMIGVDAPTKWEVDHLNTDHKNWTADNLQWVTAEENRRRGMIARRMRRIGLDPKLLTRTLLLGIYGLPDPNNDLYWVETFIQCFADRCRLSTAEITVESIRQTVAEALDYIRDLYIDFHDD